MSSDKVSVTVLLTRLRTSQAFKSADADSSSKQPTTLKVGNSIV